MRARDAHQPIDPYRTSYDGKSTSTFFVVFGILLAIFGLAVAFFATGGYIEITDPVPLVILGIIVLGLVFLIFTKRKSKQNNNPINTLK